MSVLLAVLLLSCMLPATDPDHAVVTLSNGERIEGAFSLTDGKKLEVFDAKLKHRIAIDASEVARVSVRVESETLEQEWMWKEESDHTKIILPHRHPRRQLETEVTLTSGEVVRGHATCVFYVEPEGADDATRLFLVANQQGERDQKLEDLVYVKEVVLPNRKVAASAKLVTLRAPAPAAAVGLDRLDSFEAPLVELPTDRYDLFLFPAAVAGKNPATVRYGLTGDALSGADLARVQAKVDSIEEFFPKKHVVAATREGTTIRAFLELSRTEESTDAGWAFVRWEVWTFEPVGEGLDVGKRLFLHRLRYQRAQGAPAFAYVNEKKLASVRESGAIE